MDGVSRTALAVAAIRAFEDTQPDRLFSDPYAARFLDAMPGLLEAEQREYEQAPESAAAARVFAENVVLRTRFLDDFLRAAIRAGIEQCVILAAGLDTRAYRLDWPPGSTVYELDLPEVFVFKDSVLPTAQYRHSLGVDLRTDWTIPLRGAGFHDHQPCTWLIEGLLLYLGETCAIQLFERVTALSAPGSRLAVDLDDRAARATAKQLPAVRLHADLWQCGLPDADQQLRRRGWLTQTYDRATLAAEYGRPGPATGQILIGTRPPEASMSARHDA